MVAFGENYKLSRACFGVGGFGVFCMSFGGIDAIWIASGGGVLFLALVVLLIMMARGSSRNKKKAVSVRSSSGESKAMLQSRTGDASKPLPRLASAPEKAAPVTWNDAFGVQLQPEVKVVPAKDNSLVLPTSPLLADRIVGDFKDSSAWCSPSGGALPPGLDKSEYALGPLAGVQSASSLAVRPSEKYIVEYSVRMVAAPKNGKLPHYIVGPMFLDADGKVLSWGSIEAPLNATEHSGRIEVEAPPGATRVHLYIGGLWAHQEPHPDGVIAYKRATLQAVKP